MFIAITYLLAILVAELVTVFEPMWGIGCHIAVMVTVIVHSAMASTHPHRRLLLALALVPLVRIISLSMPLTNIPQIWWYPLIYAPLLVAAVMAMRILDYKAWQVGLTVRWLPIQLVVGLTGLGFGMVEYLILAPEAMVAEFTWQAIWVPALLLLLCTGFVEEFIFRGVLQHTGEESLGGWGIIYISLIFAILHIGFLSWLDVIFVFVVALFFGWVVKKTGSLLGVTLSHGITNIVLFLVAPLVLG